MSSVFSRKALVLTTLLTAATVGAVLGGHHAVASDHDDGTSDVKTQNTNLTDLYVFTEKSIKSTLTTKDLIFVMNSNPRSLPRQQYYFHTGARYEFHISRVGVASANGAAPTGKDDVILRFEFGKPIDSGAQPITVSTVKDGLAAVSVSETTGTQAILTTPLDKPAVSNAITLGGKSLTVFAGLREDPFFFDVDRFFQVRDSAAKRAGGATTAQTIFRAPKGLDFVAGKNVLSIVARVPLEFLQETTTPTATTFDVWETISVKM